MFHCFFTVLVFFSSFTDSSEIVPAFRDSILQGNATAAVDMISEDAILMVDSVLGRDPEQVSRILLYFGLQIELSEMENMDGRQLMTEILSAPSVSGLILIFGFVPEEPAEHGGRMFVPIHYGVFGELKTIYLEVVSEQNTWKIQDFFEILPE